MLYILTGSDKFSKLNYVKKLASNQKAEIVRFTDQNPPLLSDFQNTDLFGNKPIYVLESLFSPFGEGSWKILLDSPAHIVFLEELLDKRKNVSKQISKSVAQIIDFPAPVGKDLEVWISEHVKSLGGKITPDGLMELAQILEEGGEVNLFRAHNEIVKLVTYCGSEVIDKQTISSLVVPEPEAEVWSIVNAIASRNRTTAFQELSNFFSTAEGADEKSKAIQLLALISEQLRGLLLVQNFLSEGMPDRKILEQTGWKSGRLFMAKKTVGRFTDKQISSTLEKFMHLDSELKTSSPPPRVLIELIVSQIF